VVNVWGAWCGPCRSEASDLQFVAEQTAGDGVTVLGVDVRDDRAAAMDFVRDRGLTYDSVFDPPARTLAALTGYPRNTVPSTIVLDRRHRVAAVYLTAIRVAELIPLVRRLAAELQP
jgi:thiol-disulfide isomerase/thioredoxin